MGGGRKKPRRKSRSAAIYIPVAVLLVLFIGIFGTSVFLRVTRIVVTGAVSLSEDEIIKASGISKGDNLLLVDIYEAVRKIRAAMPYVDDIAIIPSLPDTIVIELSESAPLAVIHGQGTYWVISSGGRILEQAGGAKGRFIEVTGITPLLPEAGELIEVEEGEETRLRYMTEVLKAIEEAGIQDDVASLDVSNIANISFEYGNRFTVKIGSADNVRYKLEMMAVVIDGREDSEEGTINVSGQGPWPYGFVPANP